MAPRFINKLLKKSTICQPENKQEVGFLAVLSDTEVSVYENYFFRKGASDEKEFVTGNEYWRLNFIKTVF